MREKILYWLVVLFFITLYFPDSPVINNGFIGLIFIHSFFYNSSADKRRLLVRRPAILLIIVFYFLNVISALFSTNKHEAMVMLGMRVPLLLFPVSLGLIHIGTNLKERIIAAYAWSVSLAALACIISAVHAFLQTKNGGLLYNDSLTAITGLQSIYFSLMVNIAIFSFAYLLIRHSPALKYTALGYLALLFLLGMNFLLASRVAIIDLYATVLVFAIFYIIRKRKFLEGAALLMGLLIGSFLLVRFFPKTINRFRELSFTEYNYASHGVESHYNMEVTKDQWNGANIRLAVWSCGWELAKRYPVFGAGIGDKKGMMMGIYRKRNFDFALKTERNMHNNYLDVLCTFGVVGLLLFLFGYLFLPVASCLKHNDPLGLAITIGLTLSMVSETYLDRSLGCILVGFFLSFMFSYKTESTVMDQ